MNSFRDSIGQRNSVAKALWNCCRGVCEPVMGSSRSERPAMMWSAIIRASAKRLALGWRLLSKAFKSFDRVGSRIPAGIGPVTSALSRIQFFRTPQISARRRSSRPSSPASHSRRAALATSIPCLQGCACVLLESATTTERESGAFNVRRCPPVGIVVMSVRRSFSAASLDAVAISSTAPLPTSWVDSLSSFS